MQPVHRLSGNRPLFANIPVDNVPHVADEDDALGLEILSDPGCVGMEYVVGYRILTVGFCLCPLPSIALRVGDDGDTDCSGRRLGEFCPERCRENENQ